MIIKCACGCGTQLEKFDKYGRPREFISGHNGRKYKDPTQYKREWNHRNRASRYSYKMKYYRDKKRFYLEHMGGKCVVCELKYDGKNAAVFHFHHNSGKKDFNIGNNIINFAKATILKELKKCVLVCANCHAMKHSAEF